MTRLCRSTKINKSPFLIVSSFLVHYYCIMLALSSYNKRIAAHE